MVKRYTSLEFDYLSNSDPYREQKMNHLIFQEILQGLKKLSFTKKQQMHWMDFVETLGESRIDAIVSNQHRKAYYRATEAGCVNGMFFAQ